LEFIQASKTLTPTKLKNPNNFVIASVRNPSKATELESLLKKYPKERSAIVKLDIDSPESIKSAAVEVSNLLPGGLDVFVSNAGVNFQPSATFEELFVSPPPRNNPSIVLTMKQRLVTL